MNASYPRSPRVSHLLLPPHLQQRLEILIPGPLRLQRIQRLAEQLLHAHVAPLTQQLLDPAHKRDIDVARKGVARIVGQDAYQHDRIVLDVAARRPRVREILADSQRGLLCGVGTRLGSLDDGGEVQVLVALMQTSDQQAE